MLDNKSIQQLDLNLLKIFEVLFQEKNMTRAAEVLFISPSAVSHGIKRLRNVLGDPLFVRQGQSMVPTASCARMAPQLISALSRIRQILQQSGDFIPSEAQQTFKIAIHEALEQQIVPELIHQITDLVPLAQLHSVKLNRENMIKQLTTGEIDLVVDVARRMPEFILHQSLQSDPFCVVFDKRHHNIEHISQSIYMQARHVAVSNRSSGPVVEDVLLQQLGIHRHIAYRCQNYLTALAIILNGPWMLTMPYSIAVQYKQPDIAIVEMPIDIGAIHTHLYWHKNTADDAAMQWFREQVVNVLTVNRKWPSGAMNNSNS